MNAEIGRQPVSAFFGLSREDDEKILVATFGYHILSGDVCTRSRHGNAAAGSPTSGRAAD